MSNNTFNSFEELAAEFIRNTEVTGSVHLVETRRLSIETTDPIITNIMPSSFPNPEEELIRMEERFERIWENDLSISETKEIFISKKMHEAR